MLAARSSDQPATVACSIARQRLSRPLATAGSGATACVVAEVAAFMHPRPRQVVETGFRPRTHWISPLVIA